MTADNLIKYLQSEEQDTDLATMTQALVESGLFTLERAEQIARNLRAEAAEIKDDPLGARHD